MTTTGTHRKAHTMNRQTLDAAREAAQEFIRRADALDQHEKEREAHDREHWQSWHGDRDYIPSPMGYSRVAGDVKRQSMELTRALVALRKAS